MRSVKRAKPPVDLARGDSPGAREILAAIEFFAAAENREGSFPFKAYKGKAVIQALHDQFHGKCAYCESRYAHVEPMDIEHYRPKSGYLVEVEGKPTLAKPGYYWLAADWKNLLPSCIDCNRARQQEVRSGKRTAGKANQFPLAARSPRATAPGEEKHERRLLLNPCEDQPEKHLVFGEDGTVDPKRDRRGRLSPKGQASITVYALDRKGLVDARLEKLKRMQVLMTTIERLAESLEAHPGDATLRESIGALRAELEDYAAPTSDYSLMARQAIDRFERRLLG